MPSSPAPSPPVRTGFDAVVIAASLGGPRALAEVLAPLPAEFPAPIFVAQHLAERSPGFLPTLLARWTALDVVCARDGERPRAGAVYLAPPGRHLLLSAAGRCLLSDGARVNYARPSADLLFLSAAETFGMRALGVVLTGRLSDGAAGAEAIRQAGGAVLVQAPETCRAPDMPLATMRRGAANIALPPSSLAAALTALVAVPGARDLFGIGAGRAAAA
ncbi:MAG: chemotaxis protein CheB [Gemmatimonadaceae bacterium]